MVDEDKRSNARSERGGSKERANPRRRKVGRGPFGPSKPQAGTFLAKWRKSKEEKGSGTGGVWLGTEEAGVLRDATCR